MKTEELKKLREKDTKELEGMVVEKKRELANAYANRKASNESNLKIVKNTKRDIAQILTIIREKEIVQNLKEKEEKSSTKGSK